MNDPEELMREGVAAYNKGDYAESIDKYDRLLSKNPAYEKRDETRLMLALSYAAAKNYKKSSSELEKLYNDPLCKAKAEIFPMLDYSQTPDTALHQWECCNIGSYGYKWVYGVCWPHCKTPTICDANKCDRAKPN